MLTTPATVSARAYLEAERTNTERNEFLDGEIISTGSASYFHDPITANPVRAIGNALSDDYIIRSNDMRVPNPVSGSYFYPDVVIAGEPTFADDPFDTLLNPVLEIEVLSPGTEAYDRDKALVYRHMASLQEYPIVSQDEPTVEHWVRLDENKWQVEEVKGLDRTLLLGRFCGVKVADIYRKVLPKP